MRGTRWARLLLLVMAGVVIAALGYRQYLNFFVPLVWVARQDIVEETVLTADLVEQRRVYAAGAALTGDDAITGWRLRGSKSRGEPFYREDLQPPPRSWLSEAIPPGRVLYTLNPDRFLIPYQSLRQGDRLDVLVTAPVTRVVARDVVLLGVSNTGNTANGRPQGRAAQLSNALGRGGEGQAGGGGLPSLVLGVRPENVFSLVSAANAKEPIALVLHGKAESDEGVLLDVVPAPLYRWIEVLIGLKRERVRVKL